MHLLLGESLNSGKQLSILPREPTIFKIQGYQYEKSEKTHTQNIYVFWSDSRFTPPLVDTEGVSDVYQLFTLEEKKHALVHHGDLVMRMNVFALPAYAPGPIEYSPINEITWPCDTKPCENPTNLGKGASAFYERTNHAVAVIGWGPCQVPRCPDGTCLCGYEERSQWINTECWIIQNSWGIFNKGINGYDFVDTEEGCDAAGLFYVFVVGESEESDAESCAYNAKKPCEKQDGRCKWTDDQVCVPASQEVTELNNKVDYVNVEKQTSTATTTSNMPLLMLLGAAATLRNQGREGW